MARSKRFYIADRHDHRQPCVPYERRTRSYDALPALVEAFIWSGMPNREYVLVDRRPCDKDVTFVHLDEVLAAFRRGERPEDLSFF